MTSYIFFKIYLRKKGVGTTVLEVVKKVEYGEGFDINVITCLGHVLFASAINCRAI